MAKSAPPPLQFVSRISLVGRGHGAVKLLSGFNKKHHTVPDTVNATTTAFLGRLCAGELAEEGEGYFQRARAGLGYKRADLSLELAGPGARLVARDFVLEIDYALTRNEPASYEVTRTLHSLGSAEVVDRPEFDALFAGVFSGLVFGLTGSVSVEAVVDAIEAHGAESDLTVEYPSDCRHCVVQVDGLAASVRCDGSTLEMRFPRNGSPRELIAEFVTVRSAFALTKNRVLAGLL